MKKTAFAYVATLIAVLVASSPAAFAALTANSTFSQTINNGVISTDIRDASNNVVASPSFGMSAATVTTTGTQTTTGTFGTSTQRISVDNPGGANNGFSITLNAATPGTGTWTSGSNTYPYNGTTTTGQLTVNPSAGTWTALTGSTTAITKGTSATFTGTTAITLATAASGLEDIWNGYVTGITLSQIIPANKPAGTYTITMVQTVAAL
jgi:hypothetical protein